MQLTWTTEPPSVPGFYFLKMASGTRSMVYLSEADIKDKDWHGCIGQWVAIAGPIQEPIDNDTARNGGENGACDQMGVDS